MRAAMPQPLLILIVLIAGAVTAVQAPTNAVLARAMGSPVNAAFVSFAVGTLALGAIALAQGTRPDLSAARALPWWAWIGGCYGALFVASAAYGATRLGVGLLLTLSVAAQLLTALLIDSTGLFGVTVRALSAGRLAGVALAIAGVLMVRRG